MPSLTSNVGCLMTRLLVAGKRLEASTMPGVERECTTHHYACDCREARFARMEAALQTLLRAECQIAEDVREIARKGLEAPIDARTSRGTLASAES